MEENVRLIVLEHLRNELDVHVLDIDFLLRVSMSHHIVIYALERT